MLGAQKRVVTLAKRGGEDGFSVEKHLGEVYEEKFLFVVMVTGSVVLWQKQIPNRGLIRIQWLLAAQLPSSVLNVGMWIVLQMLNDVWLTELYKIYRSAELHI